MSTRDATQPPANGDAVWGVGRARRKPDDPLLLERLAETGFLATEFGLDHQAEFIFRHLIRLRPGKSSPRIALAMVEARCGRMHSAIEQLRQLMEEYPDLELARAVLGTMLLHVGEPGALQLLEDIVARSEDPGAVSVAASCIEQAQAEQARASDKEHAALEFHRHHNIRA
jgi:predicted Zn-dependent protease